ncbi:MAG: TauD/TfdA dioxygenase family protein [Pseudomonadota bacterium]
MTVAFRLAPLPGPFGQEVLDIDVADLGDEDLRSLLTTLYENRFLVLRTGGLQADEYLAFARRIGIPIALSPGAEHPEIAVMDNRNVDRQKEKRGPAHWHSDQSFRSRRASVTMLFCSRAPREGGETRFCDLAGAYAALSDTMKARIDDLTVIHRHGVSVAARPGDHTPIPPPNWDQTRTVHHPLVLTHPVSGVKTLYAISGTSQGIVGMSPEAGTALLQELCEHAFQDRFVTSHRHRQHDITMWDNPTSLHSATPMPAANGEDNLREVHRISLVGDPPVFGMDSLHPASRV